MLFNVKVDWIGLSIYKENIGEKENDVGTREVGGRMETHGQEQAKWKKRSTNGRNPSEEANQNAEPYGEFPKGDNVANERRPRQHVHQQCVKRTGVCCALELRLNRDWTLRIKEIWITELLKTSEEECDA